MNPQIQYKYIFDAIDNVSKIVKNIEANIRSFGGKTIATQKHIQSSFTQTAQAIKSVETAIDKLNAKNIKPKKVNIENITKSTTGLSFDEKVGKARSNVLQATPASIGFGMFAKSSLNAYAELEQQVILMNKTFGADAQSMMNVAKQIGESTALNKTEVMALQTSLKQSAGMEDIQQINQFIEDTIKGIYGSGAGKHFNSIMEQIKQGLGKNKLETVDIKVIESWGMPIKKELAKTLGITLPELMKKIGEKGGGITREMVVKTFERLGKENEAAIRDFSASTEGTMQRTGEAYKELQTKFGELMVQGGGLKILEGFIKGLTKITEFLTNLTPFQKKAIFYFTLFVAAIAPIGIIAGSLLAIFTLILNPIVLVVAGLVAVITYWKQWRHSLSGFQQFLIEGVAYLFLILKIFRSIALTNPFIIIGLSVIALIKTLQSIPDIMDKLYQKFAWIRKIADFFVGLKDEDKLQLPQNLQNKTTTDLMAKYSGQQNVNGKIDVNVMAKNADVTTYAKMSPASGLMFGSPQNNFSAYGI